MGLMICVFCISHVPALLTRTIPATRTQCVPVVFLSRSCSRATCYVPGKLGRRKSRRGFAVKTVAGFVGGVACTTLLGASVCGSRRSTHCRPGSFSLVLAQLMGFLGGLVMSAIKRDRGVKDWGTMIEGHGGMLDRLDSVCFSAPVFFHIVRYWWTP
jgi:phosphatidate cytidylyltransferase